MTALWRTRSQARGALGVGLAILAILLAIAPAAPRAVLAGWLIGFVTAGGVGVGCVVLLLIHRLTGGRWALGGGEALTAAAGATPWLALLVLPLLAGMGTLYPWVSDPGAAGAGVAAMYLNVPGFVLRSVVAVTGWSVLAAAILRGRCTTLIAALGLAFHAVMVTLVSVDWVLSIEPRYASTAFGTLMAIQQLASALAWCALMARGETPARQDVAALLLAAVLGTFYLAYMTLVVDWYGNLPDKAQWYLNRTGHGWIWLAVAAGVFGLLIPLLGLVMAPVRRNPRALRPLGAAVLIGVFCHVAWLIAPAFGALAVAFALAAVLGMGLVGSSCALAAPLSRAVTETIHEW